MNEFVELALLWSIVGFCFIAMVLIIQLIDKLENKKKGESKK